MLSKSKFTDSLNKLGNYKVNLVTHLDPRGRKFYSGFISNPRNGKVVYVTTESYYNAHCENKFMARRVRYLGDYGGGNFPNLYAEPANAPMLVHTLLRIQPKTCEPVCEDTLDLSDTVCQLERLVAHWGDD